MGGHHVCEIEHDWFNALLTFGLCLGLIISYLPQHLRIIQSKSSEGLSPLYLLLGTVSAACAVLNILTLQSGILKCCTRVAFGTCVEISAGVVQLGLQWICFSLVFVLYIIYFPERLRYINQNIEVRTEDTTLIVKSSSLTPEWKWSMFLAWVAFLQLILCSFVTVFVISTSTIEPGASDQLPPLVLSWGGFLGTSAAACAVVQYAPQIINTYKMKLVGALSIPMMLIQTPGGVLMVTSIALRPGTNWTSWITFAIAAVMQGTLLIMCLFWKRRQHRLGIDDFGQPLNAPIAAPGIEDPAHVSEGVSATEQTPLLGR